MKNKMIVAAGIIACCWFALNAKANNIEVNNAALTKLNTASSNMLVKFDLSWDNSWRVGAGGTQRDAAWVFVKYKPAGSNEWRHATLSTNGGDHAPATDSVIDVPLDGKGAFIYRSSDGTGSVNYAQTGLRWNYGADGQSFQKGDQIEVSVHAIEMVYIPEGAFHLGSGGNESAHFYKSPTETDTYVVTSEAAIDVGTTNGNLYYATGVGGDGVGPIPAAFPKGYAAFYCMKYEISQGQYVDFLNKLTPAQANSRYPNYFGQYRHTIHYDSLSGKYIADAPDRACNWLNWADGAAYADWACLRPMTELEFEKACRGTEAPVPNEYAWGTTIISAPTAIIDDGTPYSKVNQGNCNCPGASPVGPFRCGIFAASTNNPTREQAGATFYGVMEMSGNLWERYVTVYNAPGRSFTGLHGNGVLASNGNADVANWPGTDAVGAGFRGGRYHWSISEGCVSDRSRVGDTSGRAHCSGALRAVRSAP